MPARAGLSPQRLIDTALAIVDESGVDALTLARVARRSGVATPSLYKHVTSVAELHRLVRLRVLGEFDEALRSATLGRAGEEAVRALATGYRAYLRAHPHRHPLLAPAPDDPETDAAADRIVAVARAALRGFQLSASGEVHAIRCLRAAIHGFTQLEAAGGFALPEQIDHTFTHLVDMLVAGVTTFRDSGLVHPGEEVDRPGAGVPHQQ